MHIDWWTLALQTVNVLILIWILARFFFRPVVNIVARRQQQANKLLADAAAALGKAAEARDEADKARADVSAERDRLVAEARTAAQQEKAILLAQSAQETAKLRGDAEAAIVRDRSAAEQAIVAHASALAVDIAQRLLGRLPGTMTLPAFLDGLCNALRALTPETRASFTSAPAGPVIEVVTASPLSKEETREAGDAIKAAIGSDLPLAFRADPAVIAGIEVRSRNTIVRNSWRGDLERIRQELDHDKQAHES